MTKKTPATKTKKSRTYPESIIQAEAVKVFSQMGIFCFMCPNGEIGAMTQSKISRLISLGFRSGISDLILVNRDGKIFFLEFKTAKGKQSPAQIIFQSFCEKRNWPYAVARSVNEAINQAREWGLDASESPLNESLDKNEESIPNSKDKRVKAAIA